MNPMIAMSGRPMQIDPPPDPANGLMKVLQMQGAMADLETGRLKSDEYKRGIERSNRMENILSGGGDAAALRSGGFLKEANDWEKSGADVGKIKADTAKAGADTQKAQVETTLKKIEHGASALSQVKDPTSYATVRAVLNTQLGMQLPEQYDPAVVQATIAQGQTMTQALQQKHQELTLAETTRNNTMTDNRVRSEGAANRGVQVRGQDLADSRTRETTAAALSKPFEITGDDGKPVLVQQDKQGNIKPVTGYTPKQGASKPLTDTQAKALQFGSRMQAAEDVIAELAGKGVSTSIPGSRGGYGVGATINALQPADRQRLDQSKRDFINAVLRRESGAAISPSEFDSAEKQYFPQPGETDSSVLSQKQRNRELATRGILAEVPDSDARVAKVRGAAVPPAASAGGLSPAEQKELADLRAKLGRK